MLVSRRSLLRSSSLLGFGALASASVATGEALTDRAFGPFTPDWSSLSKGYQVPEWFRDAKFGLWAHWGPQCVPMAGDWYARGMYEQGSPAYQHHLAHYGHPADVGFMELIHQWSADAFDPQALVSLYKKAGAKYLVTMANHHDNFDNFDSKFHDWNAVKVGPKKDIVGMWAKAAKEAGLRFGVSNHSAHAWHWYQVAYGYDPEGARAGERYDAFKLNRFEGQGKWWEGLDPQELYTGATIVPPDRDAPGGLKSIEAAKAWREKAEGDWPEYAPVTNPAFVRQWYLRCKDLIDTYDPDLVYFDNYGLPLEQAGLDIAAHYYNRSIKRRGMIDVVINCKKLSDETHRSAVVEDVERGLRSDIQPLAWQTDTCIGHWHYDQSVFENRSYQSAETVIHLLCDIVSKNGNLLLNIPVRPDGTIDSEEHAIVEGIGTWMSRFGEEAIYGTRPWRQYGEGPTAVAAGMMGLDKQQPFTSQDIRYTAKGGHVYAMTLGKPQSSVITLKALAKGKKGRVARVTVADRSKPLTFIRDAQGLHIQVPDEDMHAFGIALKISGANLQ